uniref:Uncharacterized protein n=1 Tax=CrAss-like virus sp. ctDAq1 TaxID=2826822 RepID=A0A8S5QTC7_9CAUD|nr:MAG TPA: hypothetical protein [CrAss-like virus sp. ctDAq1]
MSHSLMTVVSFFLIYCYPGINILFIFACSKLN